MMKTLKYLFLSVLFISANTFAQEQEQPERKPGHTNNNKFKQLYDEFSTPNMFRTASGAPGPAYYQQQADYKMDIVIDDDNAKLSGYETITYTNNSPDPLNYLWVQLDQNMRAKDSETPLIEGRDCAYVIFDKDTALCGIEQAYNEGLINWKKPVSCHLYPVRVKEYSDFSAVNYHKWHICSDACELGKELGVPIYKFVKEALVRKFGEEWYADLEKIAADLK